MDRYLEPLSQGAVTPLHSGREFPRIRSQTILNRVEICKALVRERTEANPRAFLNGLGDLGCKVAWTIRSHGPLIMNWFEACGEVSSGAVEGLNNKVKLLTRRSYGFRTPLVAKLALLQNLGHLPEPKPTHRFC